MQAAPLILTLKLDDDSQAFFDAKRKLYFPAERNFLNAHLTLFHQLPDEAATIGHLRKIKFEQFQLQVTGLQNLGAGVAYKIESPELLDLHKKLSTVFKDVLIPQDKQAFRPHIVVMNKQTPEQAKELLAMLSGSFNTFKIQATGLDLWVYQGGPWQHKMTL